RGYGHAVEECVNRQAEQHRASRMMVLHLFRVSLFPEVKVRRDGVLEQVHQEKADQNGDECLLSRQPYGLRNHFDKRHGEHVARAERQEILQVAPRPFAVHHEVAAEEIASGGHQPQQRRQRNAKWQFVDHGNDRLSVISFQYSVRLETSSYQPGKLARDRISLQLHPRQKPGSSETGPNQGAVVITSLELHKGPKLKTEN